LFPTDLVLALLVSLLLPAAYIGNWHNTDYLHCQRCVWLFILVSCAEVAGKACLNLLLFRCVSQFLAVGQLLSLLISLDVFFCQI
jgi:hypothetical protein